MMQNKKKPPMLDAPIPGQSLTSEPGARPWEKPAKYSKPEDALKFYLEDLSRPKKMASILDKIEEGAPITLIADTLQTLGVSKGLHSLDVGILISPVLVEFLRVSAENAEVDYRIGTEEDTMSETDSGTARKVASELFKEKRPVEMLLEEKNETTAPEKEMMVEDEEQKPAERKGLMARKKVESEVEQDGV